MDSPLIITLVMVGSYLFGSTPFAYIVARMRKGVDIKKVGDGNAGASNVGREIGSGADAFKGAAAILLAGAFTSQPIVLLCGATAVAGHNWPVFRRFKGGRGLATTIGVLLALLTVPMAIVTGAGILSLLIRRNLLITGLIMFIPLFPLAWFFGASTILLPYAAVLLCFAGIMHMVTTRRLSQEQKKEALRWQ